MTAINRDGVIRLARIALAADAAIGSLRRVADVTRFDRGERGDSNSSSNEQLFSQEAISNNSDTGSSRPLIANKNKQVSYRSSYVITLQMHACTLFISHTFSVYQFNTSIKNHHSHSVVRSGANASLQCTL